MRAGVVRTLDLDFSGAIKQEQAPSKWRPKDIRQFRGEADMAIFGRDQDHSNGHESYSYRTVFVPGRY